MEEAELFAEICWVNFEGFFLFLLFIFDIACSFHSFLEIGILPRHSIRPGGQQKCERGEDLDFSCNFTFYTFN